MRSELVAWAKRCGGVFTRAEALRHFAPHVLDRAHAAGAVVRVLPSTYALAEVADGRAALREAALLHRPDAALAGLDALDVWAILDGDRASGRLLLVTDALHRESKATNLRVIRRFDFRNEPPDVVVRSGMRVTCLERTIIDCWPLLPAIDRRAPAIVAIRERRTTGSRLLAALEGSGRVVGAAEMRRVFRLVAGGCHSELELWGHEAVFTGDGLSQVECQVTVRTARGAVYVDRYYAEEMVAVELDGAAYHGAPGQRERDIRRDAALAALGIQTIRFSHPRLFGDPAGARAELIDVLRARRRQLGRRPA